mmetsp:Transcript_26457/g.41004  ORF Transcript_26457/g.41004 Transcript_26457/m.41004 type:complete len:618 (-) Transcript_26457:333-2186(-)
MDVPTRPSETSSLKPQKRARLSKNKSPTTAGEVLPARISTPVCVSVLDSGGWSLKYGEVVAGQEGPNRGGDKHRIGDYRIMPNVTGKLRHQLASLVGDEVNTVKNQGKMVFQRPLERGYCTDLGTQLSVWKRALLTHPTEARFCSLHIGGLSSATKTKKRQQQPLKGGENRHPISAACCFLLTQPFTPCTIRNGLDDVIFKDLGFGYSCRRLSACMAAYRYNNERKRKLNENDGGLGPISNVKTLHDENIEDDSGCCLVVDSGFSFTHIVPTIDGKAIRRGIRRVNVGGKLLTNHLKEVISYRQWNMMDEFMLINDVKEKLCFVSTNVDDELRKARSRDSVNYFDRNYILPDFVSTTEGSIEIPLAVQKMQNDARCVEEENKDLGEAGTSSANDESEGNEYEHIAKTVNSANDDDDNNSNEDASSQGICDSDEETREQKIKRIQLQKLQELRRLEREALERQVLSLSVERFSVPEILFDPREIGIEQSGICEAIVQSVNACDKVIQAALLRNIILIGGNANLPFLRDRIARDLRMLVPSIYPVRIQLPHDDDPVGYAWRGARDYAASEIDFIEHHCAKKVDWEESIHARQAAEGPVDIWLNLERKSMNNISDDYCIM